MGPTLWDKTLPYDGDTFQLEYMDLEEFLSENGIPPSPSQHDHSPHPPGLQPASSAAQSVMDLSSRASAPIHPGIPSPNCMQSPIRPGKLSGKALASDGEEGEREGLKGSGTTVLTLLGLSTLHPQWRLFPLQCHSPGESVECTLCTYPWKFYYFRSGVGAQKYIFYPVSHGKPIQGIAE